MKYVLPCQCGQHALVDSSQAGEQISCQCGVTLDVPTLRGLRQLEVAQPASDKRRGRWTLSQGLLFDVGMILLVAGAASGVYLLYQRSQLDTSKPDLKINEKLIEESYSQLTGVQMLGQMRELERLGLGKRNTPQYVQNRHRAAALETMAFVAFAASGAGLLCAATTLFLKLPRGRQGDKVKR